MRGRHFLLLGTAFHTAQDLLQPDAADEFVQVCQWGISVGGLGRFALNCIGCKPAARLLSDKQRPSVSLYSIDLRHTACLLLHRAAL